MNVRQIFENPYVQATLAISTISTIGAIAGFTIIGPKIIEHGNFQDAQELWKSGNTLCQKTNEPVVIVGIPKNIMDQLSVAEPTVETPSIKNLYILNPGSDTNDNGMVGFTCQPTRRDLPGTELSQIFQHHNSRG
ncbi:MAG: hypothetical protein ACK5O9_06210 [Holosporales bacterium]|jgi:hypothetical protein